MGLRVPRAQQAPLGDHWEIPVLQADLLEACLPVLERVGEGQQQRPREVLAHQLAQVALAGDEAHQGHRPVGVLGLHQLAELGALAAHEGGVRRPAREPQDQLVEEQGHRVVAQVPCMLGEHRQALVQGQEGLPLHPGGGLIGAEEGPHQVAHQADALIAVRRLKTRRLEARPVPAPGEAAPAGLRPAGGLVQRREEVIVP
ncbi:MAG: hypothetical protein P8Y27_12930 [Chromatiaceae bacterium]